jgi:alginate O-acetyltransferase complex protein AlgI
VFANYALTLRMDRPRWKKAKLVASLVLNIALLAAFKYTDFLLGSLNALLGLRLPLPGIALPIGISFFTFQTMSYVVDVYRGVNPPQKSPLKLLLYVSFFPQLIAGPIIKYHDVAEMLDHRALEPRQTAEGIRRFIVGLSKKVLIANTLGLTVDLAFGANMADMSLPVAWAAAVGYTLQLYFDFSGYSDMAIGLGAMFGFKYKENFDYPLISSSIREFWQRWHISLTTWFREYLYFPLGGNRKGSLRTGLNIMIVFFLTGLWHGAEWTFVAWGVIHGIVMLLERGGVLPVRFIKEKAPAVGHAYTCLVVVMAFVLFRAESFPLAFSIWKNMFAGPLAAGMYGKLLTPSFLCALGAGIVGAGPWLPWVKRRLAEAPAAAYLSYAAAFALLMLCALSLASSTHNPFIYFRF